MVIAYIILALHLTYLVSLHFNKKRMNNNTIHNVLLEKWKKKKKKSVEQFKSQHISITCKTSIFNMPMFPLRRERNAL